MEIDFSALQIEASSIYVNPSAGVAIHKGKYHGYDVAVKEISISQTFSTTSVLKEIQTQCYLQHPNICRILGYFIDTTRAYILIEWMGQDLFKEIETRKRTGYGWSEGELWGYYMQLISAFAFAQSNKIAHRDIKPQNIFMNPNKEIKIGDFGCARYVDMDVAETLAGSPYYLSPQLKEQFRKTVSGQASQSLYNPYKSDVYSLGLTFLHMLLLHNSPELMNLDNLPEATAALLAQIQYPSIAKLLIYMLNPDQDTRCDFLQLFEWFNCEFWTSTSQYLNSQDEGMIREGLTASLAQPGLTLLVTVEKEGLVVASVSAFETYVNVEELPNACLKRDTLVNQCSECQQNGAFPYGYEDGTGAPLLFCSEPCQQTHIQKYQQLSLPSCIRCRHLSLTVQLAASQATTPS